MDGLTIEAMEFAARHYGVVSDDELEVLGVNRHRRERLTAAGVLVVIFRGVYRARWIEESFDGLCRAACLASPHCSAAATSWSLSTSSPDLMASESSVLRGSRSTSPPT